MLVESHDHLRPQAAQATRVVIYDDLGNPLFVAVQLGPRHIRMAHVKDPQFQRYLEDLGIRRTTVVRDLDSKQLSPPRL